MAAGVLRVGCSGWDYPHWRGLFYPADVPRREWFAFYATRFDTVELDSTFYRLPAEHVVDAWAARAPRGFRYALKASRYLTHLRRLREPADPLALLFARARRLGRHLGPVLYQLPPRFRRDDARLAAFLEALPRGVPQVLEVRDASWYAPDVERSLARTGIALCLHDMPGSAPRRRPVGPFLYVRLHGADRRFRDGYPGAVLRGWADFLAREIAAGLDAWIYFNNDTGGHAPADALRLRAMLSRRLGGSP